MDLILHWAGVIFKPDKILFCFELKPYCLFVKFYLPLIGESIKFYMVFIWFYLKFYEVCSKKATEILFSVARLSLASCYAASTVSLSTLTIASLAVVFNAARSFSFFASIFFASIARKLRLCASSSIAILRSRALKSSLLR